MLRVFAHAKINLYLAISGVREDGYHLVDMVMQSLQLHDTLTFAPASSQSGIQLECSQLSLGKHNLVYRAAELVRETYGIQDGIRIQLDKSIPAQAGMGGGSADAAAAILGCCKLWGIEQDIPALQTLGLRLGADVPFCLVGGTARVQGIGETVTPFALPFDGAVAVLHPGTGISTPAAYHLYDQIGSAGRGEITSILQGKPNWPQHMRNDLQKAGIALCPQIPCMLEDLQSAKAKASLMTGSGSAVFGLFSHAYEAQKAAKTLSKQWPIAIATQFCNKGCTFFGEDVGMQDLEVHLANTFSCP